MGKGGTVSRPTRRRPTPAPTADADDTLADALRRALLDERDEAVRRWIENMLAGDDGCNSADVLKS